MQIQFMLNWWKLKQQFSEAIVAKSKLNCNGQNFNESWSDYKNYREKLSNSTTNFKLYIPANIIDPI